MGLNQDTHTSKTYLGIVSGKFAKRVPEGTNGAIAREIEFEGVKRNIHELHYSSLDAMIDGIEIKEDGKFGDQLLINLRDVDDVFTINLSLNSREAKGFMMCLPNIDLTKIVNFAP